MAAGAGRRQASAAAAAVKVRWKTSAIRDLEAHVAYLDQFNPLAARELAITLLTAGDSLSVMPNRGRPGRIPGTRELLAVSPYVILYEVGPVFNKARYESRDGSGARRLPPFHRSAAGRV